MSEFKIAVVSPYPMDLVGGVTSFIRNLHDSLQEMEQQAILISPRGGGKIGFAASTLRRLRRYKPDLVHTHSAWYALVPAILYKKLCRGRPLVIHTIQTEPVVRPSGFKKKMHEALLTRCDAVTFVSGALMNRYQDFVDVRTERRVVYGGARYRNAGVEEADAFRSACGLKSASPLIIAISPFAWKLKVQGIKVLIRSMPAIRERHPSAMLAIAGEGHFRKELEGEIDMHELRDTVVLMGNLDDVFPALAAADIYAHISLQEGLPLALLEAMGVGKPVVATPAGGIPEVVVDGENGLLVEAKPEAVAGAVLSLLKDEARMRALGENAENTIAENFTWTAAANRFLELYRELLLERPEQ